jgi:hypothetical protein
LSGSLSSPLPCSPTLLLRGSNSGTGVGTHRAFLAQLPSRSNVTVMTGEKRADFLKTADLRVNVGDEFSYVHGDQCTPDAV